MSDHSFEGNSETGVTERCSCDESLALREALCQVSIALGDGPLHPTSPAYLAKRYAQAALGDNPAYTGGPSLRRLVTDLEFDKTRLETALRAIHRGLDGPPRTLGIDASEVARLSMLAFKALAGLSIG